MQLFEERQNRPGGRAPFADVNLPRGYFERLPEKRQKTLCCTVVESLEVKAET